MIHCVVNSMNYNDDLRIFRGGDFIVNDHIKIRQPTLGEICDFGEQKYFSLVHNITATPTDCKYQLSQSGLDWNVVDDFELFIMIYRSFNFEDTRILFGDLNFQDYVLAKNNQNEEICLLNEHNGSIIDRLIYEIIVDYIRSAHYISKNVERAMTETTKDVLLEEAKEIFEMSQDKEYKSYLVPLISTLLNMPGFNYTHLSVWDVKINAFMDSVGRMQKIKNVDLLLQGGYSGGIDLKKVNKKELNYFSELV